MAALSEARSVQARSLVTRFDVRPSTFDRIGPATWSLNELSGRLVELSGDASALRLTAAFGLVCEAQRQAEPVAWVMPRGSSFFPPDAAAGGVDLNALVVVRVPNAHMAAVAADELLRSSSFGLVVVDVCAGNSGQIPAPLLTRLLGLCQTHCAAVIFLTEKKAEEPSLTPLVSLRAEPVGAVDFTCDLQVLKDKRRGPGWTHQEICHGPPGLR